MRLIYTPNGKAIPDAQLREVATQLALDKPNTFEFSTCNLIDYIRLEVLEGRLDRLDVTFELDADHRDVFLNKSGNLDPAWTNEFYDGKIFCDLFRAELEVKARGD